MDDMISRAAAIEVLGDILKKAKARPGTSVFEIMRIADCNDAIKGVPAVNDVPVVHGRWVEEPDRTNHYHCSNCGVVWGVVAKAMKYCPNCATKMLNSPMWEVENAT